MNFKQFAQTVEKQFKMMSKHKLFIVDVAKDDVWDRYLSSFPEGTNPIYKTNTEHDCFCCKQFIRNIGNIVTIINQKVVSIWDIKVEDEYQVVADKLSTLIHSKDIKNIFLHFEAVAGKNFTNQLLEGGDIIRWNHFHCNIPSQFVSDNREYERGNVTTTIEVFKRGLDELKLDALERVKQLILDKQLYKGDEFKNSVNEFIRLKKAYDKSDNRKIFIWSNYINSSARFIRK